MSLAWSVGPGKYQHIEISGRKKLEILADFIKNNITAAAIVGH
jgi:hypothetical protein